MPPSSDPTSPESTSSPLPSCEVVAAAVERDGRILLGQRPPDQLHVGGRWEFPGGKVDAGETHVDALARELREELAIDVEVGEHLASVEHAYPHRRIVLHLYRCRLLRGEPEAREHADVRWVRATELERLDLAAADRKLIDAMR